LEKNRINNIPKISVIMPVYNTALYLKEAIESILNQTYDDFEFIIIDDASTDGSKEIIKSYSDERIIVFENEVNKGYVFGLNYAISIARGEYIARMDSDDIAHLDRFKKQIDYFERKTEIDLIGTWYKVINSEKVIKLPERHDSLFELFLNKNGIAHPTVMFKRSFFIENNFYYDVNMMPAEDYELWVRFIKIGKLANIPEVLLYYREHTNQISHTKRKEQNFKAEIVRWSFVNYYLNKLDCRLYAKIQDNKVSIDDKLNVLNSHASIYNKSDNVINNIILNEYRKIQFELFLDKENQNINSLIKIYKSYRVLFFKNDFKLTLKYILKSVLNFV
jgi:glycosyltransferase involved in cell wall biosynthesis